MSAPWEHSIVRSVCKDSWAARTRPGCARELFNVAYALLGHLVERVSSKPFADYCAEHIFRPLCMTSTDWYLRDVDTHRHAIPYGTVTKEMLTKARQSFSSILPAPSLTIDELKLGYRIPHCLYSFATYPDGLLRTTVEDLALFLASYADRGANGLLEESTIRVILSENHDDRSLCWHKMILENCDIVWGHGGGDPGVRTYIGFRERDGTGMIIFLNGDGVGTSDRAVIVERLFRAI